MKVTLGTAPDSWGVWFPSDPHQTPWERFVAEVAEAGYRWIELGPPGYLPTDAVQLNAALEQHGLSVSGSFVMFDLEDEDAWAVHEDEVRATCELLAAVGASFLVIIDDVYTDLFDGTVRRPRELDDQQWQRLVHTVEQIAGVARECGLTAVLHPHAQTHIDSEADIERFLAMTPAAVGLCLDVGHHAYSGGDPVSFLRKHHDRIPYLHLKNVDGPVRARVSESGTSFAEAVGMGIFVEPHDGLVDFDALRDVLDEIAYEGFGIVEHDLYPTDFDAPLPIAKRTFAYLRGIGFDRG